MTACPYCQHEDSRKKLSGSLSQCWNCGRLSRMEEGVLRPLTAKERTELTEMVCDEITTAQHENNTTNTSSI